MGQIEHLTGFQVVELRRYACREGAPREEFARYFETYFPEAFEHLGSLIFGQFLERADRSGFVWIRGFHDMPARAAVNEAFYGGPLWKEHATTLNDRLLDHTNVLLLRPLTPERGLVVLPAVDPVAESSGARGVAVAQIFAVVADEVDAFALGVLKDDEMLETGLEPVVERSLGPLTAMGLLRAAPELLVLDPTRRSRLRWL